jgi:hypothetical protein
LARKTSAFIEIDGLAIIKSKSARLQNKTRKEFGKIFEQFDFKITPKFFRCYFRPEQRKTQTIQETQ